MKVKILISTLGYIIGSEIVEKSGSNNTIEISNPGIIQVVKNPDGSIRFVITEFVPHFLKHRNELTHKLPINKQSILYTDDATEQMEAQYHEYVNKLIESRSGISIAKGNIVSTLKKLKANSMRRFPGK